MLPCPGATLQCAAASTTVHGPPWSAEPHPGLTVRLKVSDATVPFGGGGAAVVEVVLDDVLELVLDDVLELVLDDVLELVLDEVLELVLDDELDDVVDGGGPPVSAVAK
jgi:hypothetical protein